MSKRHYVSSAEVNPDHTRRLDPEELLLVLDKASTVATRDRTTRRGKQVGQLETGAGQPASVQARAQGVLDIGKVHDDHCGVRHAATFLPSFSWLRDAAVKGEANERKPSTLLALPDPRWIAGECCDPTPATRVAPPD